MKAYKVQRSGALRSENRVQAFSREQRLEIPASVASCIPSE